MQEWIDEGVGKAHGAVTGVASGQLARPLTGQEASLLNLSRVIFAHVAELYKPAQSSQPIGPGRTVDAAAQVDPHVEQEANQDHGVA